MKAQKNTGGNKLTRTETVTIRLDPKLKYLAEIAARKQRRTLSSFIEWAVEESLEKVVLEEREDLCDAVTVTDVASQLWHIDESERFLRLAINYPDLLNYEEQEIFMVLSDSNFLKRAYSRVNHYKTWNKTVLEDEICPALRKEWDNLKDISSLNKNAWIERINREIEGGKTPHQDIQKDKPKILLKKAPKSPSESFPAWDDDEIPF